MSYYVPVTGTTLEGELSPVRNLANLSLSYVIFIDNTFSGRHSANMPLTAELRRRTSKYYFKLLICVFIYRVLTVNSQPRPKSTLIIMTAIILPHELIYQIIDEVYDQNSTDLATMTLTSCSLTAHKFLHHCRQLIFRHIRVIISPPANPWAHRRHRSRLGSLNTSKSSPARSHLPTCRKFHYLLEASPHIASYVRGLTIIDHSSGVSTETFEEEMLPVMMNKLTLLSALHIRWSRRGISTPCRWNVGPETFKHAVSATLQLPTMTHLTLGGMCFDAGSLAYLLSRASALKHLDLTMAIVSQDEGSIPALHTGVTPQLLYPQLESLALPYRDYLSVLEDFLSLKPPPARATLRKLCVSPEPETLVPTWNFLRSAVGGFLQHLVIFGVIIRTPLFTSPKKSVI